MKVTIFTKLITIPCNLSYIKVLFLVTNKRRKTRSLFAEKLHRIVDEVLDYAKIDAGLMELFEVYQSQALDPNVNRKG